MRGAKPGPHKSSPVPNLPLGCLAGSVSPSTTTRPMGAVPSSPIGQSVCPAQPCLGLSLLHPLLCLLGWGFSRGARSRLGIWVHPLSREGEQRVCTDSESNRTNSWRKNKPIRDVKSVRLQMTPSCGRWGLEAAGGARQEQDTALSPTAGTPDPLCSLQKLSVPTSPLLGGVTRARAAAGRDAELGTPMEGHSSGPRASPGEQPWLGAVTAITQFYLPLY